MYGTKILPLASVLIIVLALLPGSTWADHTGGGDVENGEEVYNGTCIACHADTGKGALDGVPDLTKPNGRLSKDDHMLLDNIMEGVSSAGSQFPMPALGGDEDLEVSDVIDVIAYMHKAFGNR